MLFYYVCIVRAEETIRASIVAMGNETPIPHSPKHLLITTKRF